MNINHIKLIFTHYKEFQMYRDISLCTTNIYDLIYLLYNDNIPILKFSFYKDLVHCIIVDVKDIDGVEVYFPEKKIIIEIFHIIKGRKKLLKRIFLSQNGEIIQDMSNGYVLDFNYGTYSANILNGKGRKKLSINDDNIVTRNINIFNDISEYNCIDCVINIYMRKLKIINLY